MKLIIFKISSARGLSLLQHVCAVCDQTHRLPLAFPNLSSFATHRFLCCFLLLVLQDQSVLPKQSRMWSCTGVDLSGATPSENCLSLSPTAKVAVCLVAGMRLFAQPPLHAGIWSGLGLHRFCKCCQNCCRFISAAAPMCPQDNFPCNHPLPLALTFFLTLCWK